MDHYLIIHEYTCPECNGDGYYYDPLWIEANAAYDKAHKDFMDIKTGDPVSEPESEDAYYSKLSKTSDAGWKAIADYFEDAGYTRDPDRWPSEELPCAECDGDGTIRTETTLLEALQALGFSK